MFEKVYYGYFGVQSSNHEKLIEEEKLSKCDEMIFIKYVCIDNKKILKFWKLFTFQSLKVINLKAFKVVWKKSKHNSKYK